MITTKQLILDHLGEYKKAGRQDLRDLCKSVIMKDYATTDRVLRILSSKRDAYGNTRIPEIIPYFNKKFILGYELNKLKPKEIIKENNKLRAELQEQLFITKPKGHWEY